MKGFNHTIAVLQTLADINNIGITFSEYHDCLIIFRGDKHKFLFKGMSLYDAMTFVKNGK